MMAFFGAFSIVISFYIFLFVLKCNHKLRYFERLGFEFGFFQVKWFSHKFNRVFLKCGNSHKKLVIIWFTVGSIFCVLLILPSMLLLVRTLITNLLWLFEGKSDGSKASEDAFVITPVVPGLNMPLSRMGYYISTLLICSVVHEFGHAVTSVSDDVTVIGAGIMIMIFVPAAYVELATAELNSVKKHQQLRIFTAGIWNNVVLSLLAYLLLVSMPYSTAPLYAKEKGISVIHVEPNSTVVGPSGLKYGDIISSVNGCNVSNRSSWQHCLAMVDHSTIQSFCIQPSVETDSDDCCQNNTLSASSLCFLDANLKSPRCLRVRTAIEKAKLCNSSATCLQPSQCLTPSLKSNTKLLQIKRLSNKDFLFVGNPAEVFYYSQITDYVLNYPDHWTAIFFNPGLPSKIELLLYYVASLSAGLAVLNAVPCFMLDGQHVAGVLVEVLFPSLDKWTKSVILLSVTIVGSLLIVLNITFGILRLVL